jgi:ABC-type transporter Mla subunit MlaD
MPLQDLTPELRTRLRRAERNVGWFVTLAAIVLVGGFAYYVYATAKQRGWFVTKLNYSTSVDSAAGLAVGDPVSLMGFNVGEITKIKPNDPVREHGVSVFFNIRDPYWGYIWYDSRIRVNSDLLTHRSLEVVKGVNGPPSAFTNLDGYLMVENSYLVYQQLTNLQVTLKNLPEDAGLSKDEITAQATNQLMESIKSHRGNYYTNAVHAGFTSAIDTTKKNYYYIPAIEEQTLSDRLAEVAARVQDALPGILSLTNKINDVLTNANFAVSQLNGTLAATRPTLTNLAAITDNLRDPHGSLGNWILTSNLTDQLDQTMSSARQTLGAARDTLDVTDTNLTRVAADLDATLQHLSDLTSNLATEVRANTNLVSDLATTIVHADDLVQGLKKEWFLRGPFKKKRTQPAKNTESREK